MTTSLCFRSTPVLVAFCGWLVLCGCGKDDRITSSGGYSPGNGVVPIATPPEPGIQTSEATPADVTESKSANVTTPPKKQTEIVVLVAASAQEAVGELAKEFSSEETAVKISADDSSRLAQQIIAGAPADLFLSASLKWVDAVDEKGLVVAKVPLLGNTLVVVCPAEAEETNPPITIQTLADFPKAKLAIAGPTVPAGIYGRQALKHQHWLEKLEQQEQLVIGNNVRETLAYVERGEAELGIVYATDAMISKNVKVVHTFAADSHDPIVYPLALVKSEADHGDVARQFFEYLQSDHAKNVFENYGFQVLSH